MLRNFIQLNISASKAFDKLLPALFSVDGNRDFVDNFAPIYIAPGSRVVDVGGGKNPFLSLDKKKELRANVTGVDISKEELLQASDGLYDNIICADISKTKYVDNADVCICQAVLEHVLDTEAGIKAIANFLKPGGIALIFVPSRNAIYANLNLLLPETFKKRLLYWVYPNSRRNQGFPSYYDRCTPKHFREMAKMAGLEVVEARYYFVSSYFSFLFPVYIIWRFWIVLFRLMAGEQAAETFSFAFRKVGDPSLK